ncbi:MAG: DUF262 domain-containing protein [Nitrospira sp.]|nr:DUF262 domain-containing protein [Nitrospira sp.]
MEASTTIRKMMKVGKIVVPSYQRAYSWDTPSNETARNTQTDVFLMDLEEYKNSQPKSPYYFGHFLFEEKGNDEFCVIDGQQRLTTIVIFLSVLFEKLKRMRGVRDLTEDESNCKEDMIKLKSKYRFSTVDYDNQLFIDYVIVQSKKDDHGLETESARRIVRAFNYFSKQLSDKTEEDLTRLLSIISKSSCTTHLVKSESEAIQMFIFQNNRGKRPSNLEIVKAKFMYHSHLYGHDDKDALIAEIKNRFEKIYKSIASIEYRIDEDDVLLYTLRVYFNSLGEANALNNIETELGKEKRIDFIKDFTESLANSFEYLSALFGKHEHEIFEVHSLLALGGIAIAFPFILKAYKFGLPNSEIAKLCSSLESLLIRDRLIRTRADITPRIAEVFKSFTETNKEILPIVNRIEEMKKTSDQWLAYWNDTKLQESLQGSINHSAAKYLLWKYENHLRKSRKKAGYDAPIRFDKDIKNPELEHIAPKTEPKKKPHGYDKYDDDFIKNYIDCLGNYLLLSESHNRSIQNTPFPNKHKDYDNLEQQKEVRGLVPDPEKGIWSRELIQKRKKKIIHFVMDNC